MSNQKLYRGMSKTYDLLDVIYFKNKDRSPRVELAKLVNQRDVDILDICTGTAANAIVVAAHHKNAKIVGIDISQEMLLIASRKIHKNAINNIELCRMDASNTTFQDQTFDVILISLVLHEISEELADHIMLEAKRVLKPDGKILIVEWEEPQRLLQKILFYLIRKTEPKGFEQFLKKDLKQYFDRFQLDIVEIIHSDYTKVFHIKKSLNKGNM